MPPLNGALPFPQSDDGALAIAEDLHLYVVCPLHILLHKHACIPKAGLALPATTCTSSVIFCCFSMIGVELRCTISNQACRSLVLEECQPRCILAQMAMAEKCRCVGRTLIVSCILHAHTIAPALVQAHGHLCSGLNTQVQSCMHTETHYRGSLLLQL